MNGLHRGHDSCSMQSGHIIRMKQLKVLDPVGEGWRGPHMGEALEGVEDLVVGEVTDGVNRQRDAPGAGPGACLRDRFGIEQQLAPISRFPGVGFDHSRRARPERTIREQLEIADADPAIPVAAANAELERRVEELGGQVLEDPNPELTAFPQALQGLEASRTIEIVNSRDAHADQVVLRGSQGLQELLRARRRHTLGDQRHGALEKQATGGSIRFAVRSSRREDLKCQRGCQPA